MGTETKLKTKTARRPHFQFAKKCFLLFTLKYLLSLFSFHDVGSITFLKKILWHLFGSSSELYLSPTGALSVVNFLTSRTDLKANSPNRCTYFSLLDVRENLKKGMTTSSM